MTRQRQPFKREAEKRFTHKVDVPVPTEGLGAQLNDMLGWCEQHAGEWAYHGHSEAGELGEPRRDFARFYFMREEEAEAFRGLWSTLPAP